MSTALTNAFYSRLAGVEVQTGETLLQQQRLATLLTTDEDGQPFTPARKVQKLIRYGSKGGVAIYPEVTFRPGSGRADNRFWQPGLAVDNAVLDLEIWDDSENDALISDIADCIERLTEYRFGAPALALGPTGVSYQVDTLMPLQVLYDAKRNAWFGLMRLTCVEGR